jgi:hypothetical protein
VRERTGPSTVRWITRHWFFTMVIVVLAVLAVITIRYHASSTCQLQRAFGVHGTGIQGEICNW